MLHGVEIALFFNSFGKYGQFGIVVSAVIITIVIYKVFSIILKNNITTYNEFLNKILNGNKKTLTNVINNIINTFLLISFLIMVAGILTFFKQELGIDNILFSIFIGTVCYFTLMKDLNGVIKINLVLVPILVFCILFIGIKFNYLIDINVEIGLKNNITSNWCLSSLLYTSYNCVVLIPILISLKNEINNKRQICIISIVSGIIIGVLAIIIYRILFVVGSNITQIEIPLVYIVGRCGEIYKYIYGIVILFAIFTSAILSGYAFLENVSKNKKQYKIICVAMCIVSISVSKVGFSSLVNFLYPIFGCLGMLQIIYLLFKNT